MSRILFTSSAYRPDYGGLEILCEQLIRELRSRGQEIAVIAGCSRHASESGWTEWEGVPVLRARFTAWDPMVALQIRKDFTTLLTDFDPDLIHAHDVHSLLPLIQAFAPRPLPVVHTVHTVLGHYFPAGLPKPTAVQLQGAAFVTCVSHEGADDLLRHLPDIAARLSVVPNAIEHSDAGAAPFTPTGQFLCIGRLEPEKGFDVAIAAMRRVVNEYPAAHLVIAGAGSLAGALARQVGQLGLDQQVSLLGLVDHDVVPKLIAESIGLVMPSRWEGMPLVLLEAAEYARPVIGTSSLGGGSLIDNEVTGLTFPTDDADALADLMLRLLRDSDRARDMGENARRRFAVGRSVADVADDFEAIYESALAASRP